MRHLSDHEIFMQIRRLVHDCFDNWERWRWSRSGERDYVISSVSNAYLSLRTPTYRERAMEEIGKHGRLHVAILKKWGTYKDF